MPYSRSVPATRSASISGVNTRGRNIDPDHIDRIARFNDRAIAFTAGGMKTQRRRLKNSRRFIVHLRVGLQRIGILFQVTTSRREQV